MLAINATVKQTVIEHFKEVHAKIKDYACNQCDSKTDRDRD